MLDKNKIKLIKSLAEKKNRQEIGLFLAEGNKLVKDILESSLTIDTLIATDVFLKQVHKKLNNEVILASQEEINRASLLKTPQQSIALVRIPAAPLEIILKDKFVLCLDDIQDPGNLGTIVRLADWFGIDQLVCSENTVDLYNPKTIQATMGSICRVKVVYFKLRQFFERARNEKIRIIGSFPEGQNIYQANLPSEAVIVIGNEGNGIDSEYYKYFSGKISIPNFSTGPSKSESLNVSIAAAVICSEFKRRTIT